MLAKAQHRFDQFYGLWIRYIEKPHRQQKISDRQGLIEAGTSSILGVLIAYVTYNYFPVDVQPFPYFKAIVGIALGIVGGLLTWSPDAFISFLSHHIFMFGLGLVFLSAEAGEIIDSVTLPYIYTVLYIIGPGYAVSILFPPLAKTPIMTLASIIAYIAYSVVTNSIDIEVFMVGAATILGVFWVIQEFLNGDVTHNRAFDTCNHVLFKIIRIMWRKFIAVSYQTKKAIWFMVEHTNVALFKKSARHYLIIHYSDAEAEMLGPFASIGADRTGGGELRRSKGVRIFEKVEWTQILTYKDEKSRENGDKPIQETIDRDWERDTAYFLLSE